MPRSRYSGPRTPRRRKVWAEVHTSFTVPTSVPFVVRNLLTDYEGDVGVSYVQGLTVMSLQGQVQLTENGNAASPAPVRFQLGFAWVPQAIASASAGDSQIPEPGQAGVREDRWYQEGELFGLEPSSATAGLPAAPIDSLLWLWKLETRNMQRQPTVNHQFCLIGTHNGLSQASTLAIRMDLRLLLALP